MTGSMRAASILGSLLAALACSLPAMAQEVVDGHRRLAESEWGRLSASLANQQLFLDGRWVECHGDKVYLYKAEQLNGLLLVQQGSELWNRLVADRDADGQQLVKRRSAVRVFGRAQRRGNDCVLMVTRVQKLEDDDARFLTRLAGLGADPDAIHRLGEEVAAAAARYDDPRLRDALQRVRTRELQVRQQLLSPEDHEGALQLGRRMEELGDRLGAIRLYADLEGRSPLGPVRDAARERLVALNAILDRGAWIPFEEFKRAEGFLERKLPDGRVEWVSRQRAELEQVRLRELADKSLEAAVPRTDARQHGVDAEAGRITRGQTLTEVRRAAGMPVEVQHLRAPDRQDAPALWTQWVLADGRRVYFLRGEVIAVISPDVAWPE